MATSPRNLKFGRRTRGRRWRMQYTPSGSAAAFTPSDVTGLRYWYDFSDITTLFTDTARSVAVTADNDVIGSVTDKAGALHLIRGGAATTEPVYKTAIINSRAVARFDGTNDYLKQTAAPGAGDASYTGFVLAKKRTASTAAYRAVMQFYGATAILLAHSTYSPAGYVWYRNSVPIEQALTGTVVNATVGVVRVNSAASLDWYADGGSATNFNPHDDVVGNTTGLSFGAAGTGTSAGDFDIGEVIVYDSALAAADINLVGSYLGTRWGTTWSNVA